MHLRKEWDTMKKNLLALAAILTLTLFATTGTALGYSLDGPFTYEVTLEAGKDNAYANYRALEDALCVADGEHPLTVQITNQGGSYYLGGTMRMRLR